MKFELHRHNIDKVKKALTEVEGKTVCVNDVLLEGVVSIGIGQSETFEGDPVPGVDDGGKTEHIDLTFNFANGKADYSFCPDESHCEIRFETDNLWIISVRDWKKYVEKEKFDLDFRLKEYEEHMNK